MDAAYTPSVVLGAIANLGGGDYRITGTDEVTITGTAGPTDFF